jgi:ABC-type dipeptide/oligopeptide/nickel transport system permease component
MRLSALLVIALSVLYVVLFVVGSAAALWHRTRIKARQQGEFMETFSIPMWWWALLVGPPLLLVGFWIGQRLGGGRTL